MARTVVGARRVRGWATEASVKPQGGREHVIRDFAKTRVAALKCLPNAYAQFRK